MHFINIRCVSLVFMYVKLDSDSYSHIRMESREYYSTYSLLLALTLTPEPLPTHEAV